ncbi:uncharacterized protein SPSK_05710 [Sporothrix schenckii 1099-18]|uniref:Uncharacterized protein n=1 Tax=Sporothrix schenckii 1099-18 TaxID=1397361 RepID=A0A0F2LUS0_SPOSC|nr:uncharacterized protein SPSK_05710 [Sporothrix schenckii 1099-18]KJR80255.1 hypothetical protein SPSK_05710 [Sporothrix schenckii 1099-18]
MAAIQARVAARSEIQRRRLAVGAGDERRREGRRERLQDETQGVLNNEILRWLVPSCLALVRRNEQDQTLPLKWLRFPDPGAIRGVQADADMNVLVVNAARLGVVRVVS